jgi:hypothetical protein
VAVLHRPARRLDLHEHLTTLFVCAVATVLFTRALLAALGYPQVGGSKFHIAHVLYGGLLLLAGLLATLAFVGPVTRTVASVLGGVGFGLFIDEVGKFVTKDVNYFYRPAIAIIYVCFVLLFVGIRWLSRRWFTATEATLAGLDALQRAALHGLTRQRRDRVLRLMRETDATTPLARDVTGLLEGCELSPDRLPVAERVSRRLAARWVPLTQHRLFPAVVLGVLAVAALISAAETGWLLRDGFAHLSFSQRAFAVTTVAADGLLVVGATQLTRTLVGALHWYDHAVLLEITVGQVFLYGSEQLAATLDLVGLLALWALIRWAIDFETERAHEPVPARPLVPAPSHVEA